jgi:hypothetical protein
VAISQACFATGENHERAVLKQLLGELDLEGVLIQADALHTQRPFFNSSRSGDFQEWCHSLAAIQATSIKCSARIGSCSSGGLLIQTSSG